MRSLYAVLALSVLLVGWFTGTLASAQSGAEAESAENPVVLRLNDERITREAFDRRFEFYITNLAAQQGLPLTEETRPLFDQLRSSYLEQLATERLVQQLGPRLGVSVPEGYVEEQVARIRGQFEDEASYLAALEQAGIGDEAQLRLYLAEAELSRETVAALREMVTIPEYLLRLAYDANRDAFTQPEQVCARHILLESEEEARALLDELRNGADFAALAQENSLDPGSAARGGDLGCFGRGMTVPEFEQAAFTTPVGSVSQPVTSEYGVHLILPYEWREAVTAPLDEVEPQLREALEQTIIRKVLSGYRESLEAAGRLELFPERLGAPEEAPEEGREDGG